MSRTSLGRRAIPVATGLALLVASAAQALSLEILAAEGLGSAEVSATAQGTNDADTDTDSSSLPGSPGVSVVLRADALELASAFGRSAMSASTDPEPGTPKLLQGDGMASVWANSVTADGFALASAEQSLRIEFRPSEDALVRLSGTLFATDFGAGDAFALLELASVDPVVDPLLVSFEVGAENPDPLGFGAPVTLHAGERYRLLVVTRAGADALGGRIGDASGSAFAAYAVWQLTEVPEPATALLVAAGIAVLAGRRRR